MKSPLSQGKWGAFTLVELLTVIAIIGVLAALLLPVLGQAKSRAKRIQCVSDLREMGVAFHVFENDHNGKLPTQVSTNDSGSLELVTAGFRVHGEFYFSFRHFLTLAGALATPKPLACPADLERLEGTNFNQFDNWNLSYLIGLAPNADVPAAILAADRNFSSCRRAPLGPTIGSLLASTNYLPPPYWGMGLHERKGNVLFADGHVEESYDATFPSECSVPEYVVYPDVKVSGLFTSTGGTPPGSAVNSGANVGATSSPPSTGNPNSPSSAAATQSVQSNPISLNRPVSAMSNASNARSIVRDSFTKGPMADQAAETRQTNRLAQMAEVPTNTAAAMHDDSSGMSFFDWPTVKKLLKWIGWVCLLWLLLLLLWLSFKLRRGWKGLHEKVLGSGATQSAHVLRRSRVVETTDGHRRGQKKTNLEP